MNINFKLVPRGAGKCHWIYDYSIVLDDMIVQVWRKINITLLIADYRYKGNREYIYIRPDKELDAIEIITRDHNKED